MDIFRDRNVAGVRSHGMWDDICNFNAKLVLRNDLCLDVIYKMQTVVFYVIAGHTILWGSDSWYLREYEMRVLRIGRAMLMDMYGMSMECGWFVDLMWIMAHDFGCLCWGLSFVASYIEY